MDVVEDLLADGTKKLVRDETVYYRVLVAENCALVPTDHDDSDLTYGSDFAYAVLYEVTVFGEKSWGPNLS